MWETLQTNLMACVALLSMKSQNGQERDLQKSLESNELSQKQSIKCNTNAISNSCLFNNLI
jgi:hypothetical protein